MNSGARARTIHSQGADAGVAEGGTGTAEGAFPTLDDVRRAARRIGDVVRRTPVERSECLSAETGREVWLKLETQQRTGSFKLRGACNALRLLPPQARERGVVTASAGNHGLGVALAASLTGTPAVVFVPAGAPEVKKRRIARYGAELRQVPGGYDDAHHAALEHAARTGGHFVNAFSDPAVVAGQGTVGLEIVEDLPAVRTILVPVGGEGISGGVGIVAAAGGIRVVGVQTEATSAMHASLAAGRVVSPPYGPTLCEGLEGDVDEAGLALASRVLDGVVLVTEASVRRTMRRLYQEEGIVAEGSAVVGVAALLEGVPQGIEGPVSVVLTGSNVDPDRLAAVLAERG